MIFFGRFSCTHLLAAAAAVVVNLQQIVSLPETMAVVSILGQICYHSATIHTVAVCVSVSIPFNEEGCVRWASAVVCERQLPSCFRPRMLNLFDPRHLTFTEWRPCVLSNCIVTHRMRNDMGVKNIRGVEKCAENKVNVFFLFLLLENIIFHRAPDTAQLLNTWSLCTSEYGNLMTDFTTFILSWTVLRVTFFFSLPAVIFKPLELVFFFFWVWDQLKVKKNW